MNVRSLSQSKATSTESFTPVPTGLLQRKCASCGQHTIAGGECTECGKKKQFLQRRSANQAEPSEVPSIVHDVLRSPGQSLDAGTRTFMESQFGHDFSGVRVHTDGKASQSAQAVNALAYTVGRNVVFGAGQYAPGTREGKHLLAHELTHVVQQSQMGSGCTLQEKLTVNQPNDAGEREAETVANQIMSAAIPGNILHAAAPSTARLQRSCSDGSCATCAGGLKDLWLTAFFRRRANSATMTKLRSEITEAKTILRNCCLNLKVDFNWRLLRGSAVFQPGVARPPGDPLGSWDYPADAENLGEGSTFAGARGIPMLVVDEIPTTGGGVTVAAGVDSEYTGSSYIAISVNQPGENLANNSIAHELWHVAGHFTHNVADGGITAGTGNDVTPNYCSAVRALA